VEADGARLRATNVVVLSLPDGSPVLLAPGTTWIELVPNGTGSVTVG
jgi:hypothetical protein